MQHWQQGLKGRVCSMAKGNYGTIAPANEHSGGCYNLSESLVLFYFMCLVVNNQFLIRGTWCDVGVSTLRRYIKFRHQYSPEDQSRISPSVPASHFCTLGFYP
jgi:hypothetical protein